MAASKRDYRQCDHNWRAGQSSFPCITHHTCFREAGHPGPHACWCGSGDAQDSLFGDLENEKGKIDNG